MGSSDQISTLHHVQDHCCPCLSCFVLAVVSAESKPRYHKLEKLGCTLDQVILCAGEIEAAWNNCWDSADIQGCIAGILELVTVVFASVMFLDGWDSWGAKRPNIFILCFSSLLFVE